MSAASLCQICTAGEVEGSCQRCGRLVCENHYEKETERCVECEAEIGGIHQDTIPTGEDMPDGVDTYRF